MLDVVLGQCSSCVSEMLVKVLREHAHQCGSVFAELQVLGNSGRSWTCAVGLQGLLRSVLNWACRVEVALVPNHARND